MARQSEFTNHDMRDAAHARQTDSPTLTQVFATYFDGAIDFEEVRAHVLSAHRALRRAGTPADAITRFMRRALDTGAARASAEGNVYRFNAIHDELMFWLSGVCGQRASDILDAEPLLADLPPMYDVDEESSD